MKIFSNPNIQQLSNLCHDCRECFTVCPFTEPHEFHLNIPKLLTEIRYKSYEDNIKPEFMKKLFNKQNTLWGITLAATLIFSIAIVFINLGYNMFTPITLSNMEKIIPNFEFKLFSFLLYAYVIIMWSYEGYSYFHSISEDNKRTHSGIIRAIYDALSHKYFKGSGAGCTYPDDGSSLYRLLFHPMVFFGFIIDLITILFYSDFNIIIITIYIVGAFLMVVGSTALLAGKYLSRNNKSSLKQDMLGYNFTMALLITGLTGILFLFLSGTLLFPLIFALHIAFISGILLLAPYSKFMHPVFRFLSLVKYESK